MNTINVIAPYKHHGQWVFDDPRVGLSQEPFVAGADTWIDRVVADIPDAERGFSSFPAQLFRAINTASIGNARKAVETGIIPRISTWKAGCVQLSLNISLIPRKRFMRR
jgi:hypothetical protein